MLLRDDQSMPNHEFSVEELRKESERSREALAFTVQELRDRVGDTTTELKTLVSPAFIKKEIRNYVREERESVVQSIQQRAKDNPLQMAAIGAAVAYPALSLLRSIPTPLLLIGAGLFFTSKRGQQSAKDLSTKADDALRQGAAKASELAGAVRSDLEERRAGARRGVHDLRDTVTSAAEAVTGKAQSLYRDAANMAKSPVENTRSAVETEKGIVQVVADEVASHGSSVADGLRAPTSESAAPVKDQATAIGSRSRGAPSNFLNDNALLVAGIGVAVGAFIAASIPSSDAENKLFGANSDDLKNKAREAAAQGIAQVRNIGAEAARVVAVEAAREGVDSAGVQRALNTITDSVRKVADRGLETALGATTTQSDQQPNSQKDAS
jgi:hypothetical protein